jgi:hypothetical protein
MQEGGGAKAIGTLEFGNRSPICQTQAIECIAGLNVIDDPTIRCTARQWSLGAHGRNVNNNAGNQFHC